MKITVKELLEKYDFAAAAKSFPGVKPASEIVGKKKEKPTPYGRGEEKDDEDKEGKKD
jgi:hypothetical protein